MHESLQRSPTNFEMEGRFRKSPAKATGAKLESSSERLSNK